MYRCGKIIDNLKDIYDYVQQQNIYNVFYDRLFYSYPNRFSHYLNDIDTSIKEDKVPSNLKLSLNECINIQGERYCQCERMTSTFYSFFGYYKNYMNHYIVDVVTNFSLSNGSEYKTTYLTREIVELNNLIPKCFNSALFRYFFGNKVFYKNTNIIAVEYTGVSLIDSIESSKTANEYYSCNSKQLYNGNLDNFIRVMVNTLSSGNFEELYKTMDRFVNPNPTKVSAFVKDIVPRNLNQQIYMLEYLNNNSHLLDINKDKHQILILSILRSATNFYKIEIFYCPINQVNWIYLNNTNIIVIERDINLGNIQIPTRTLIYDVGGGYLD